MTELFLKAAAAAILAALLIQALGKNQMAPLLSLAVVCLTAAAAVTYIKPVLDFLMILEQTGELEGEVLPILLKSVGIGLTAELAGAVCADSGSAALGKLLQILGSAVILWLTLPMMTAFLQMIQEILGQV